MKAKEIIAKVVAKQALTDDELAFLAKFDLDAEVNSAAKNARKDAEAKLAEANEKLKQLEEGANAKGSDYEKLQKRFESLHGEFEKMKAEKAEADAKVAAANRRAFIFAEAEKRGIKPVSTISKSMFDMMVETATKDVDEKDGIALGKALDTFKSENAGVLAASQKGTTQAPGKAAPTGSGDPNPFAKETYNFTKQMQLRASDPQKAAALEAEAKAAEAK